MLTFTLVLVSSLNSVLRFIRFNLSLLNLLLLNLSLLYSEPFENRRLLSQVELRKTTVFKSTAL